MADQLQILTASRAKAARACLRLHHLTYGLRYRALREADALKFGTLVHRGLEAWWLAPHGKRLEAALAAMRQGDPDPFELARAEVLISGYSFRWDSERYEVLGVEVAFECELRNPDTGKPSRTWRLAGKVDAIVRDLEDGRVLIVEHKTSTEDVGPGSEYWRRLRMDGQVSVYFEGGRSLGYSVDGCLYDVLKRPLQRPGNVPLLDEEGVKIVHDAAGERIRNKDGKSWRQTADTKLGFTLQTRPETVEEFRARLVEAIAEEPERYYQRGEVVRLEAEMVEALFDVWQLARSLREAELAERHPRNPDACVRWGRTCEFFPACSGEASLDDPTLYRRIETAHPELAQEPEQASV